MGTSLSPTLSSSVSTLLNWPRTLAGANPTRGRRFEEAQKPSVWAEARRAFHSANSGWLHLTRITVLLFFLLPGREQQMMPGTVTWPIFPVGHFLKYPLRLACICNTRA